MPRAFKETVRRRRGGALASSLARSHTDLVRSSTLFEWRRPRLVDGRLAPLARSGARQASDQASERLEFEVCSLFPNHREAQKLQTSVCPSIRPSVRPSVRLPLGRLWPRTRPAAYLSVRPSVLRPARTHSEEVAGGCDATKGHNSTPDCFAGKVSFPRGFAS